MVHIEPNFCYCKEVGETTKETKIMMMTNEMSSTLNTFAKTPVYHGVCGAAFEDDVAELWLCDKDNGNLVCPCNDKAAIEDLTESGEISELEVRLVLL